MTETIVAGIAALFLGPTINYLRNNGQRGSIKPFRDGPALCAYFLMLVVGLGGALYDHFCFLADGDGLWYGWVFLVVISTIGLTGIDPRSVLPKKNGDWR
jgi:hypothetical protein